MIVELKPHEGIAIGTKDKVVKHDQWRVFVDGVGVGYLSFRPGSKVCLIERFSPIDIEEIERQVFALTKSDPGKSVTAPDVPEELLNTSTEDETDSEYDLE